MDKQDLKEIKNKLEDEKRDLEERIERYLNQEDLMEGSVVELNSFDETHPGDQGTELFEREKDMTIYHRDRQQLEEVNHALEKMDTGTYGICEETGKEIPVERLKAVPTARTVVSEAE